MSNYNLMDFDLTVTDVEFAVEKLSPANWQFHCNSKPYHGLLYVIDGQAQYVSENHTEIVTPDSVVYLAKNSTYHMKALHDKPYHYLIITFHLDRELLLPFEVISSPIHKKRLYELFRQIVAVNFTRTAGYKFLSRSLVQQLIYYLMQDHIQSNSSMANMHAVIDYIENNYSNKISIDNLSDIVGLSTSQFRKKFKELYGTSPLEYINRLRIENAKDLLRSEMYSQNEIATLCGFENVYYFNRVFKKYANITPGKY